MSNAISHIINARIEEMKLNNYEIAEKIKCTEGTVRNIRRGDLGSRSFEVVSALCKLLDIPIELLAEIEKSNMFSEEDISFLMLFRNSDSRARTDAIMLLKAHQRIQEPSEPSLIETAHRMRAKAIEQNSHPSAIKEAK